jgi:hypothetical protein
VAAYRFVFGVFDEGSGHSGIHLRRKQFRLTIVYEAFLQEYEKTVRTVSDFPGLDKISIEIPPSQLTLTTRAISQECHEGWKAEAGREETTCLGSIQQKRQPANEPDRERKTYATESAH